MLSRLKAYIYIYTWVHVSRVQKRYLYTVVFPSVFCIQILVLYYTLVHPTSLDQNSKDLANKPDVCIEIPVDKFSMPKFQLEAFGERLIELS